MAAKEEPVKYTKYERARIIGARALQIAMGAPTVLKLTDKDLQAIGYNPIEIAKRELEEGVMPLDVRRAPQHRKPVETAKAA